MRDRAIDIVFDISSYAKSLDNILNRDDLGHLSAEESEKILEHLRRARDAIREARFALA